MEQFIVSRATINDIINIIPREHQVEALRDLALYCSKAADVLEQGWDFNPEDKEETMVMTPDGKHNLTDRSGKSIFPE